MSRGADLFIVCKHCGSEVSPYITECPYCGHRLRRRAPKLPRAGSPERERRGVLGRLSASGRAGDSVQEQAPAQRRARRRRAPAFSFAGAIADRPYATIALVAASCVFWILVRAGYVLANKLVIIGPLHGDWWKLFASQVTYLNGWYAFFTLLAIAIFGWLLERRYGPAVALALFFGAGVAGALVALAAYPIAVVVGGNAGALALLAAWAAPDLRDARKGSYYEGDLLGAGAFAALLLVLPFARFEASWLAGVVGGAIGLLTGLALPRVEHVRM
ncbi:MAG TPA: rhomboid family intramembrane serine protease [Solirubrobacteraceae bacterium]|nr:rhomboid family intramembrane serine protease [Solirubrobacteraceae bacterium]